MSLSRSADYVVLDGRFLIAEVLNREGRSITANLYKTPEAFVRDEAMERRVGLRLTSPQPYHRGCSTFACQGSCEGA
jgi:hypothetical protein